MTLLRLAKQYFYFGKRCSHPENANSFLKLSLFISTRSQTCVLHFAFLFQIFDHGITMEYMYKMLL